MLQVCIDDSKGGNDFVLAGYAASVEDWKDFSNEWQALLKGAGLTYLKGNELTRILRQIEPEERERRLTEFGQLIAKHVRYSLDYTVPYDDYKWFLKHAKKQGRRVEGKYKHPHNIAFGFLLAEVVTIEVARLSFERIQFIFDSGIDKHKWLEQEYRQSCSLFPLDMRQRLAPDPIFSDDLKFMPLQAADLRAWYSHRCLTGEPPKGRLWQEIDKVRHISLRHTRADLGAMLHPGAPLRAMHQMYLGFMEHMRGCGLRLRSGKLLL